MYLLLGYRVYIVATKNKDEVKPVKQNRWRHYHDTVKSRDEYIHSEEVKKPTQQVLSQVL